MTEFNYTMKNLNLGILGLSIYTAVTTINKLKIDEIQPGAETITISKTYILGASISLAVFSAVNIVLLNYLYDYVTGSNITYKIFGLVSTGAIVLLGGFLLAQFLEINYLKRKKSSIYSDDKLEDNIVIIGLVLSGLSIGTGFFMILEILLSWDSSITDSKKKKKRI